MSKKYFFVKTESRKHWMMSLNFHSNSLFNILGFASKSSSKSSPKIHAIQEEKKEGIEYDDHQHDNSRSSPNLQSNQRIKEEKSEENEYDGYNRYNYLDDDEDNESVGSMVIDRTMSCSKPFMDIVNDIITRINEEIDKYNEKNKNFEISQSKKLDDISIKKIKD